MFEGLSDPKAYRFVTDDAPASVEELRDKYRRQGADRPADDGEIWCNWIIRSNQTGAALGYTQATMRDGAALIGYHLHPRFWKRGFGIRAVGAMVHLLFARPDVFRIDAFVDTRNEPSIMLLKRLGFEHVNTHRHADFFKGAVSDEYEFALEKPQGWQPLPPRSEPERR